MKLQKIHFVRALGYVVFILIVLIYFKKDIVNVWSTSWIYICNPLWGSCGVILMNYKKKTFPFSRGENIFSIIFVIAFVAVMVLRLVFLTQTV